MPLILPVERSFVPLDRRTAPVEDLAAVRSPGVTLRTKADWRAHVRSLRSRPGADVVAKIHANLIALLRDIPGLILFYNSMEDEVELDPVADELGWTRFAVTRTPDEGPLTIHPAIGAMERHRYGFAQPVEGALDLPPHHLSAAVVPALAFDRAGNRLGHGAGYYDELLARLPPDRPRIGVTVEHLLFDSLPVEPHDIAMTHLVTEHETIHLSPESDQR